MSRTILWRRLDAPGHDWATVFSRDGGWQLSGSAIFSEDHVHCRLEYVVVCDAEWRTTSASVTGWVGEKEVRIEIAADAAGRWRIAGVEQSSVAGCLDVDLSFTPATNLLPIKRLALEVGMRHDVRAAWLTFPGLTLEPLDQAYHRVSPCVYRYESNGGAFTADLEVDDDGFVVRYPGLWRTER